MENAKKSFSFQKRFKELVGDTATQEEIAGKVNTSRQNVGNWLNGKSKPDIYALAEISKGYGVSADWLLGLTDVKTNDTTLSGVCEYTGLNEKSLQYIENIKTLDNIRAQQNVNKKYSYMDTLNILIEAFNFNGDILLTINSMVNSDMLNDMETEDEVFEKLVQYEDEGCEQVSDFYQWLNTKYTLVDEYQRVQLSKDALRERFSSLITNIIDTYNENCQFRLEDMHNPENLAYPDNFKRAFEWTVGLEKLRNSEQFKRATSYEKLEMEKNFKSQFGIK